MRSFLFFLFLTTKVYSVTIEDCLNHWQGEIPKTLSKTCLYSDPNHQIIDPELKFFVPKYPLYTDGVEKKRWIYLPNHQQIDTTDMDHWHFPVGTILWKEFSLNGLKLETRLLVKTKAGQHKHNWTLATYQWRADQTEADMITSGADNVLGTIHQIPRLQQCMPCHHGGKEAVVGFSAIQLSGKIANSLQDETYLDQFQKEGIFTHKPKSFYKIPARNQKEEKAIGYLQGNCAHCHNPQHGMGRQLGMNLKVSVVEKTRDDLQVLKTTLNAPTTGYYAKPYRISAGKPHESAIYHRTNSNTPGTMMAPFGRKTIDQLGVKILEDWITNLAETSAAFSTQE